MRDEKAEKWNISVSVRKRIKREFGSSGERIRIIYIFYIDKFESKKVQRPVELVVY